MGVASMFKLASGWMVGRLKSDDSGSQPDVLQTGLSVISRPSAILPSVSIVVHGSLSGLEDEWRRLEESADCYAFQTWDWNAAWYEHVGKSQGVEPCIVRLVDGCGKTLGLWPLCIYCRHGLRVLGYMGDLVSDYRAPLLSPGWSDAIEPNRFLGVWRECLTILRKVDLVLLRRMPERFGKSHNPMVWLQGARHTEDAYHVRLPGTLDDYLAGRPTHLLAENRRKVRRLKEMGGFRTPHCRDAYESEVVFSEIVRQKSRRWRETGSRDLFADQAYRRFYESVTRRGVSSGFVAVSSMQVNNAVVAAHWGLVFKGRYYGILSSFESGRWRKFSCGELLVQIQIERAIEDQLEVFDLTVGDEAYKKSWATDRLALYQWCCARSGRGYLYLFFLRVREAARSVPVLRLCVRYIKRFGGSRAGR